MLEDFGRTAQTKQLYYFLELICKGYETIVESLNNTIDMLEKSDDIAALKHEIAKKQNEIEEIKFKMYKGIEDIRSEYSEGHDAKIKKQANDEFEIYKRSISAAQTVDGLKKKALNGQERFNFVRTNLQKQIIRDCNIKLVLLAQVTSIPVKGLTPVFTEEYMEKIEAETKKNAHTYDKEEFLCFSWESKTHSSYSETKHLESFKGDIVRNIEKIKLEMVNSVQSDLMIITKEYRQELEKNVKQKYDEYDELSKRLTNAYEIQEKKAELKKDLITITASSENIKATLGGFEYVIK
jgi:hypothetical protein